jgi:hypothetical protein
MCGIRKGVQSIQLLQVPIRMSIYMWLQMLRFKTNKFISTNELCGLVNTSHVDLFKSEYCLQIHLVVITMVVYLNYIVVVAQQDVIAFATYKAVTDIGITLQLRLF